MVDPISDMLTRIRNAQKAGHKTADIPLSNIKFEIAKILKKEGYVDDVKKIGRGKGKILEVILKYPIAINKIRRISKLGQRIYTKASDLKKIRSGYGIAIISTPKGLMTNKEAFKQHLGGEVLLEIW